MVKIRDGYLTISNIVLYFTIQDKEESGADSGYGVGGGASCRGGGGLWPGTAFIRPLVGPGVVKRVKLL